jgi:hypothetical protein
MASTFTNPAPVSPNQPPVVRPGRVDDLAFAITKRLVAFKAPPIVQQVFTEAEPIVQGLLTRYLGKIHFPGVPRTRNSPRKRKKGAAHQ